MQFSARFSALLSGSLMAFSPFAFSSQDAHAQTKPRVQVPATSRNQAQQLVQQLLREGKIMRPREAKRGMKGYGLSIFQGTTIEKFPIEIIGILESVNGGGDYVMFRVTGGTVIKRNSGIVEGMSGSPVYINGKLLGAIAIGFGFPKEPIGGITPITDMIATTLPDPTRARVAPTAKPNPDAKPDATSSTRVSSTRSARASLESATNDEIELRPNVPLRVAGRDVARVVVSRNPARMAFSGDAKNATMTMRPATLRLQMSGFSAGATSRLGALLSPYGLETSSLAPSRGGINAQVFGPSSKKSNVNPPFVGGGAIGAQLVSGDMDMTGVGTITYRLGNRVLGFGHPMLGIGSISMPMTSVFVHDIFPSYDSSFKLASPVRTVGTVQQDTNYAIGGTIGVKADTVPMTVSIRQDARQIAKTFRVQIIKDPVLTPNLAMAMAADMVDTTLGKASDKMVRVSMTLRLQGQKPIVRSNYIYSGDIALGTFNPNAGQVGAALQDLYEAVIITQTSDFGRGAIQSLKVNLDVLPVRKTARIKNIFADRNKVKAGETVRVSVELEPAESPEKTITKTFDFAVPADAPTGTMRIGASASSDYWALATRVGEAPPIFQNLPQLLTAYEKIGASDELLVKASTSKTYLVVDNKRVPSPPASFSRLLRGSSSGIAAFNETESKRLRLEYSLGGLQLLAIPVESAKHSDISAPDSSSNSVDANNSTTSSVVTTPAAPATTDSSASSNDISDEAANTTFRSLPPAMSARLFKTPLFPAPTKSGAQPPKADVRSRLQLNSFSSPVAPKIEYSMYNRKSRGGFILTSTANAPAEAAPSEAAVSPTPQNPIAPSASEIVKPTPSVPVATPIASPIAGASPTPALGATPSPTPVVDNGTNLARPSLRWSQSSPVDFLRGDFSGTQVTSEGTIALSPHTRRILTTSDPLAWSIAGDSLGNTFIGTGNDARLYKVTANGKTSVIYDGSEVAVTALAVDSANNVYAGVSPGGRVLKVAPDGKISTIFNSGDTYIWALRFDAQGRLLVVTGGERGKLYRSQTSLMESRVQAPPRLTITPTFRSRGNGYFSTEKGEPTKNLQKDGRRIEDPHASLPKTPVAFVSLTTVKQRHIRSIATRGNEIFIGTGDEGVLYRVDATTGQTTALYEAVAPTGDASTSLTADITASLAAITGTTPTAAPNSGEILAITSTPDAVYFGTSNSGTIFRWTQNAGVTPIYASPQNSIYAMTTAPDGSLYVATGENGVVYQVRPVVSVADVTSARVLEPTQSQALALGLAPNGELLIGTGNNAAAYRADLKNLAGGTFTSNVFDARNIVQWGAIRANARGARWQTRSGNTLEPDTTWSAWQDAATNDLGEQRVASPSARYLQYRVLLDAPTAQNQPQVSRIEVVYRAKNSAPTVAWSSPIGGEALRTSPKITWSAQDTDNDKLRYSLSISSDDGTTWQDVVMKDAITPSFDLDTTKFKDGVYRLKVAASDAGANPDDPQSATKISAPFTVDNTAPTLTAEFQKTIIGVNALAAADEGFRLNVAATDALSPISGAEWRFVKATPKPTPAPKATPVAAKPVAATSAAAKPTKPATSSTQTVTTASSATKTTNEASITISSSTVSTTTSTTTEVPVAPVADEWNAIAARDGIFDSRRETLIALPDANDVAAAQKSGVTQIEVRVRDAAGNSATTKIDLPK